MKLHINEGSAASLSLLAVIARIVYGVAVDMPELGSAGWLAVPMGLVLALPAAFAAGRLRANCRQAPLAIIDERSRILSAVLTAFITLIAAFDASFATNAIAGSASYIALNTISLFYLLFPQLALCIGCLTRGGNAVGSSAGIWNKLLPWLLLVVVSLQLRSYQPAWLFPLLGPGLPSLLGGAIRTAGWMTLPVGLWLLADPDDTPRRGPVGTLLIAAGVSTFLLICSGMMTPTLSDPSLHARYFQLDKLLSNGRATLSLQFPGTALWFMSLFYLLLFDSFTCALALRRLLPRLKEGIVIVGSIALILTLTLLRLTTREAAAIVSDWLFPVAGAMLTVSMIALVQKGGVHNA